VASGQVWPGTNFMNFFFRTKSFWANLYLKAEAQEQPRNGPFV
jgi:hypothetical protein